MSVCNPPEVPVAAILPRSKMNEFLLYPVDLKAYKPKLVAEFVMDRYPPDWARDPYLQKIWKQETTCEYPSLITRQPIPPKETMVNAAATMDLPCSG